MQVTAVPIPCCVANQSAAETEQLLAYNGCILKILSKFRALVGTQVAGKLASDHNNSGLH